MNTKEDEQRDGLHYHPPRSKVALESVVCTRVLSIMEFWPLPLMLQLVLLLLLLLTAVSYCCTCMNNINVQEQLK